MRSHAPLEFLANLHTHHHAQPSHINLETRCSKHHFGQRQPPLDRSSSNLSFYGGKTAIGGGTRLHAPSKELGTLPTRSRKSQS